MTACRSYLGNIAVTLITVFVCGCAPTRFEETYYVGVYREDSTQPLQFYRFRMHGDASWGSKVKFESGWYPASALEFAVGENRPIKIFRNRATSQPAPQDNTANPTPAASQPAGRGDVVYVVGPNGQSEVLRNQRLVLFMAVDPSPITNTIQSFAQALDAQGTAAIMAHRQSQKSAAADRKQRAKRVLDVMQKTLAGAGSTGAASILGLIDDVAFPTTDQLRKSSDGTSSSESK